MKIMTKLFIILIQIIDNISLNCYLKLILGISQLLIKNQTESQIQSLHLYLPL